MARFGGDSRFGAAGSRFGSRGKEQPKDDGGEGEELQPVEGEPEDAPKRSARAFRTSAKARTRRLASENQLDQIVDWHLQDGDCWHVFSFGDVDSLTYLKHVVRQQRVDYLVLSTWCMASEDVQLIREWIQRGALGRVDFYVGEIFKASYYNIYLELLDLCATDNKGGRVAMFRNHSKVMAGSGERFCFAIESSANVNTNPRSEQTSITCDRGLFEFYKDIFDGIQSFDPEQRKEHERSWKPWESRES